MHMRCPHCRHPIEVVGDSSLSDIECPSCGSNFSLADPAETQAWLAQDDGDEAELGDRPTAKSKVAHFQLIKRLGQGAFGTVWQALDSQLDRTVAIKIPRRGQLGLEESEQFFREARAAAQLKHPNIVSVYEVGRERGQIYIVSSFVRGETLADRIASGSLHSKEAAELCAKVADALHHAHEAGVIHRDLKPSNIMLSEDGEPHVMDFGLAKREAGEITMTVKGQILGTPAYMSPEQAKGEAHEADRRSDIFSLGVILFELLTGERPFRGNQRMLLHQITNDEVQSPRRLNSNIPRDLETICVKCLEKDPNRRYQTAEVLVAELRRYLAGKPIVARPISRIGRTWRWCKRNPTVAMLLGLTFVALTLGAGLATWQWHLAVIAREEASQQHQQRLRFERQQAKTEREQAAKESTRLRAELERAETEAIRMEAATIMAEIDGKVEFPLADEFAALRRLADSREEVRLSFIEQLVDPTNETAVGNAGRMKERLPYVLHAVVGLDPNMRDRIKGILNKHGRPPAVPLEINFACAILSQSLDIDEPAFIELMAANSLAAMRKTGDPMLLSTLCNALGSLRENLPPEHAVAAAERIGAAMENLNDEDSADITKLTALGRALGSLVENLPPEHVDAGAHRIVAAMEKWAGDASKLPGLAHALESFGEKLPPKYAVPAAQQIVGAMEKSTKLMDLNTLAAALAGLGENLPPEQAAAGAQRILTVMEKTTESRHQMFASDYAIRNLADKLPPEQITALAHETLAAMANITEQHRLGAFGIALGILGERLPPEKSADLGQQISAAMEKTSDPYAMACLGSAHACLGEVLPPEFAATIPKQILAGMAKTNDSQVIPFFVTALSNLGKRLPPEKTAALGQQIVAAMEKTTEPFRLSALGQALGSLGEKVPSEQATDGAQQIVAAMETTTEPMRLSALGEALGSLGEKLPSEQATDGAQQIMAAMEKTSDPNILRWLGSALGSFGEKLPSEQAAVAAQQIVAAMEQTTEPTIMWFVSRPALPLPSLVKRMRADDTISVLKSLFCVGDVRRGLLEELDTRSGGTIGDIWKAVEWAEKEGVDIEKVPRFPIQKHK